MRKLFSLMLLLLCHTALFAQYGGADGTFDPENPANPEPVGVRYGLTVKSESTSGGTTNVTYGSLAAGESIHLYAYPSTGYEFKEWRQDERVLTASQDFDYTMPAQDVVLTAVFKFNPQSPGNPGANDWDGSNGILIVDDFQTGSLADAIYYATDGNTGSVQTLIVSGNISNADLGALKAFTSIKVIDLSRAYGSTAVPAYTFEGNSTLTEISLPASIKTIERDAFYCCYALTTLNCYATVPPVIDYSVFKGVSSDFVVYVPYESLGLYQNAAVWKTMNVQPLGTKVYQLEVDLPADYTDGRYDNMYIELANDLSGQTMSYLITPNVQAYTFKNLRPDTKWTAYVKNADGQSLGSISNIVMGESDQRVQFASLLTPQTITAKVLDPAGNDITTQVTLTWLNANGAYMGKGASINNVLPIDGASVTLRVALSDELAMDYQQPTDVNHTVQSSGNNITVSLVPISKIAITGRVTDVASNEGIANASVVIGQTIEGRYTKNFSVKTDDNGAYTVTGAYNAATTITVSINDYTSGTAQFDALSLNNGVADCGTIQLKSLKSETNTTIRTQFTYTLSAESGQQGATEDFADTLNVVYTIFNQTRMMHQVTEFVTKGREIVITEEVGQGDLLYIIAMSKNGAFEPLPATCSVGNDYKANATFNITQAGQISASYTNTDASAATAILYDASGKFVSGQEYVDKKTLFTDLGDGYYTVVSMSRSKLFNSIYDLAKYADAGLVEGEDYVTQRVYVKKGDIVGVRNAYVPYLDESKFAFLSTNTSFSINKTLATVGTNLTLTTLLDFQERYVKDVSNVKLVIDLAGSKLVAGSVMAGSAVCDYESSDRQVVIPISNLADRVRLCVKSNISGDYVPTASVQFYYGDQLMTKPVGQVSFTLEELGLSVPATISSTTLPVSGSAPARSQIWIYDDNELIGMTMALSTGSWSQNCELLEPANPSEHHIYAVVKNGNEETQTVTRTVSYAEEAVSVESVTMLNTAHPATSLNLKQYTTLFDFTKGQTRIQPYWYWPEYPEFTFLVKFNKDKPYASPGDVELIVYTSDRRYRVLRPTRYDSGRKSYVVTSYFYTDALPISVNVRKKGDTTVPTAHKPYVEYVLDPSGYVYEGVPSNRLEGVTATIYYRADASSPASLWDATLYDQENPLLTDEYGMYAWDVPEGEWQIRFEKEGYETTSSEWLPVPPPQLNINIPMTQSTAPKVKSAKADKDGVEIEFDKYMLTESLTDNILVSNAGVVVPGTLVWLNAEGRDEDDDNQERYASRVRYVFDEENTKGSVDVIVTTSVKSYAGLELVETYNQNLLFIVPVKSISVEELIAVSCDDTRQLTIEAIPQAAAAGKTLHVTVPSSMIVTLVEGAAGIKAERLAKAPALEDERSYSFVLDGEGRTTLTLIADVPGSTALQFSIDDSNVKAQTMVTVTEKELNSYKPQASRNTGASVYRDTRISLSYPDEEIEANTVKFYYTMSTDGTEPEDPTTESSQYTEPFVINADKVIIKAIAQVDGFSASKVATFEYNIQKSNMSMSLAEGWTWVSHNLSDNINVNAISDKVQEIKSQTKSVIRDPMFGLFGNLRELTPAEAYKVRSTETIDVPFHADAYNASKLAISLSSGWNWVGYPNYQEMTLNEALSYLVATEGDNIIGQRGSADFIDGEWIGDLETMKPGEGYLLNVANATNLRYNTDIVSHAPALRHGRLNINQAPWSVNEHAYPDVMAMRAQLYQDDILAEDDAYTVAAFCGTECRGIGQYVKGVIFMNVHGQGTENITFMAANNATDAILGIEESQTFIANVVGTYREPVALHLAAESDGISQQYSQLGVWPAAATTEVNVSLGGQAIDRLTLTSTDGRTVYTATPATTQATINVSTLPAGIYIVAAKSGSEYFYKKIMKVNQ